LWFESHELAKFNGFDSDFPLYPDQAVEGKLVQSRCPQCKQMRLSRVRYAPGVNLKVERCACCKGVWLDSGAIERVRRILARTTIMHRRLRRLDEVVRREQEMWEAYSVQVAEQEDKHHLTGFEWLFMFLTRLPKEVYNPTRHRPYATIALVVINIVGYAVEKYLSNPAAIRTLTFIPESFLHGEYVYSIVTAMFLHGNLVHLAGNMYFLFTFGDNVEDFLGPLHFTLFYFTCGILSQLTYFLSNVHSTDPALGASGAISGLLAGYIILFSRRQIYVMIVAWPIRIRAVWFGLFWLELQTINAAAGRPGVAWYAHIGGFIAGAALIESYLAYERIYAPAAFP